MPACTQSDTDATGRTPHTGADKMKCQETWKWNFCPAALWSEAAFPSWESTSVGAADRFGYKPFCPSLSKDGLCMDREEQSVGGSLEPKYLYASKACRKLMKKHSQDFISYERLFFSNLQISYIYLNFHLCLHICRFYLDCWDIPSNLFAALVEGGPKSLPEVKKMTIFLKKSLG